MIYNDKRYLLANNIPELSYELDFLGYTRSNNDKQGEFLLVDKKNLDYYNISSNEVNNLEESDSYYYCGANYQLLISLAAYDETTLINQLVFDKSGNHVFRVDLYYLNNCKNSIDNNLKKLSINELILYNTSINKLNNGENNRIYFGAATSDIIQQVDNKGYCRSIAFSEGDCMLIVGNTYLLLYRNLWETDGYDFKKYNYIDCGIHYSKFSSIINFGFDTDNVKLVENISLGDQIKGYIHNIEINYYETIKILGS